MKTEELTFIDHPELARFASAQNAIVQAIRDNGGTLSAPEFDVEFSDFRTEEQVVDGKRVQVPAHNAGRASHFWGHLGLPKSTQQKYLMLAQRMLVLGGGFLRAETIDGQVVYSLGEE